MGSSSHPLFGSLEDAPRSSVSPRRGHCDDAIIDDELLAERSRSPRELFDSRLQNPVFDAVFENRLQNLVANASSSNQLHNHSETGASNQQIQNAVNDALNNSGLVEF